MNRGALRGWFRTPAGRSAVVFTVAALLRVLHVLAIRDQPFFDLLMGDGAGYDAWAHRIAAGDWLGSGVFYQAPLYPYALGAFYALFTDDLLGVRLAQALLGAGSCVWVAWAAERWFGARAGLLAGLLLAGYGPAVFYDTIVQKSVLDLFFLGAALALLGAWGRSGGPLRLLAAGVAVGALVLTRENALVFAGGILGWLALRRGESPTGRLLRPLTFASGVVVVLLPVALRNLAVGGEFHLTTSQLGPNLYIGNNPDADGRYRPLVFGRGDVRYERTDATRMAEEARGVELTPAEVSAWFVGEVCRYVTEHPLDWLRLMAWKTVLLWNGVEQMDTEDLGTYAEASPVLRVTAFLLHFGVLAPLAALGIAVTWDRRRSFFLLHVLLLTYAASVVLFYVFGRYRHPLVPMLVLFAAAGLVRLPALVRERDRRAWVGIGTGLLAGVFCNWPIADEAAMRATTHNNMGEALVLKGLEREALEQYEQALRYDPDNPLVLSNLGGALAEAGDLERAREVLERALRIAPRFADVHINLANVLVFLGRYEEARKHYERAIELRPHDLRPLDNLARLARLEGDPCGAADVLGRLLARRPQDPEGHQRRGLALIECGRSAEALREFETALRQRPRLGREAVRLAHAHARTLVERGTPGELDLAIRWAELLADATRAKACSILDTLCDAYAARGRLDDAVRAGEAALRCAGSSDRERRQRLERLRARREATRD